MILPYIVPLALSGLSLPLAAARRLPDFTPYSPNIRWIQEGNSVLIKVDIPGLPLKAWSNATYKLEQIALSSAVVLNFTLSAGGKTLLLQNKPFLPLADPNVPPHIWAPQIPADIPGDDFGNLVQSGYFDVENSADFIWPSVGLSYNRLVNPRDDDSITYYNYDFTLMLDLIGAEFAHGHDLILLDAQPQKSIVLELVDRESATSTSPDRAFLIKAAKLKNRPRNYAAPTLHKASDCKLSSWRCADLSDPPYYQYVWRPEFDERYGRIGSLRHFLLENGATLGTFLANNYLLVIGVALVASVAGASTIFAKRRRTQAAYRLIHADTDSLDSSEALLNDVDDEQLFKDEGKVPSYRGAARDVPEDLAPAPERPESPPPYHSNLQRPLPPVPPSLTKDGGEGSKDQAN